MTYVIGVILIVLGLGLRWLAIRTLRSAFSLALCRQPVIVTYGPYRFVRHPAYIGSLLTLSGVAVISATAAVLWLAVAFFLSRAVQEEQLLMMNPDYQVYRKRTGMFIPKVRF